jgi:myo-inositol 2-dehydrogenase / D-chiro-inositol 1-dehydrogenase
MKVAVIGVGQMGRLHARHLAATPGVELLVVDSDAARAHVVAGELGGTVVVDAPDALDRADAAVIATPPATHAGLLRAGLERRLPMLCEKPIAGTLVETTALAAEVRSSGVAVQVGFQRRFDPPHAKARAMVASGDLGRLALITLARTEPVAPSSPKTNLLRNTAVHDFDLVRWLSGCEVASVFTVGARRVGGTFDPRLDPDTVVVSMRLSDGSLASSTISRLSPIGYDVRAELLGSKEHIVVGWDDRAPVRSLDREPDPRTGPWPNWQERFEIAYRDEMRAFLAAASGTGEVLVTVDDGLQAERIAEAAAESLRSDQPVDLEG